MGRTPQGGNHDLVHFGKEEHYCRSAQLKGSGLVIPC